MPKEVIYDVKKHDTPSMNDNTHSENRIEIITGGDEAYVEDFRIRPVEVNEDELRINVTMRVGGKGGVYYVTATVTYAEDETAGHHVQVHRRGGEHVYDVETGIVTASPSDTFDAVQAIHDTYIDAADDWYGYAVAADEADDQ